MSDSRLAGFYRLSVGDRIRALVNQGFIDEQAARLLADGKPLLQIATADRMIENVVGVFGLPFGIAPNFLVNEKNYVVPMVVEEPSIVAGVSGAAKLFRQGGGFTVTSTEPVLIGQIQITNVEDADNVVALLEAAKTDLTEYANSLQPNLLARGGGVRDIELFKRELPDGKLIVVLHLLVDTRDAMGANIVNTLCEGIAGHIESICGATVGLCILSNLADQALVTVRGQVALKMLASDGHSAEKIRDAIVGANDFANVDPHRAATHNKGIMNGIDAVAIATGNDWRAIEAGAHAYAVRDGAYRALTNWTVLPNGDLSGELTIPLKVGIVGGSLESNPGAKLGLAICGVSSASELAGLMAATGLAQNFAALKALVSDGIQKGHMSLHARSVAVTASVPDEFFDRVVSGMIASGDIKTWKAKELTEQLVSDSDLSVVEHPEDAARGVAAGKVILFGEHAVVYGRRAVALPLPDAVTVTVKEASEQVDLSIPDWNIFDKWLPADRAPDGAASVVELIMRELGVGERCFDIRVSSRLPIGVGLGSSAAFSVAVIRAFDSLLGLHKTDEEINQLAFRCEEITHGTPSGIDNHIATFAQSVLFNNGDDSRSELIEIGETPPLVIAVCGSRGNTKEQVDGVRRRYERNSELFSKLFDDIDAISVVGAAALRKQDYEQLGSMMNVNHGLLNAIEVTTPELENMVNIARTAGALGAKVTGAGGGGSIVALCPGKVDEVSRALSSAGIEQLSYLRCRKTVTNTTAKIVSSDDECLILVDANDNETGVLSKAECHDGEGLLHRAFSVFLFNQDGELLLQQRASGKRLWPMFWSNSCCSHPRQGESMEFSVARRLQDELHASATLEFVYKFSYQANFNNLGSERELCHVFLGMLDGEATRNETEIEALRFVSAAQLEEEFRTSPEIFTPWFKMEWQRLNEDFTGTLAQFTGTRT